MLHNICLTDVNNQLQIVFVQNQFLGNTVIGMGMFVMEK